MPRIPTALEAAFLRAIEILDAHAPYLDVPSERAALAEKYAEMRPLALPARDELKKELQA